MSKHVPASAQGARLLLGSIEAPDLPMPRIYSTTIVDRANMTSTELEMIWDEYREFWRGHEGHSNKHEDEAPTADELYNTWEDKR